MLKGGYHSYMAMSIFFYLFHNFFTASLPSREGREEDSLSPGACLREAASAKAGERVGVRGVWV
jgi:hypothetical protein